MNIMILMTYVLDKKAIKLKLHWMGHKQSTYETSFVASLCQSCLFNFLNACDSIHICHTQAAVEIIVKISKVPQVISAPIIERQTYWQTLWVKGLHPLGN